MTGNLTALFNRMDCEAYSAFSFEEAEAWGLDAGEIAFIQPAATPTSIKCNGCEEGCIMPVLRHHGQASMWCDKAQDYGRIALAEDDLRFLHGNIQAFAEMLATSLETGSAQCIIRHRVYDLGTWEGHTLFLVRGIDWDDAPEVLNEANIRHAKPLLVTFSPIPAQFDTPAIEAARLLKWQGGKLMPDKNRLSILLGKPLQAVANYFRRKGDMWHVCYEGADAFIKHSNGMVYIDHLLHHPNQEIPSVHLQALTNKIPLEAMTIDKEASRDAGMQSDDPVLDVKGIAFLKAEIERLKETDPASPQIEQIEAYLRSNTYRGKSRSVLNDNEKARLAVKKALSKAFTSIQECLPELYQHLQSNLQTGAFCRYAPHKFILWQ